MIVALALGFLAMLACLALQAGSSVIGALYFNDRAKRPLGRRPYLEIFLQFAGLMLLLMLGAVVQMAIWAVLYRALGALGDFENALYFSGVTFTTLGYGDVLLDGRARLLAPLEAANGVLMFGITTALLIAAVERTGGRLAQQGRSASRGEASA